jgi:hypothetical protein
VDLALVRQDPLPDQPVDEFGLVADAHGPDVAEVVSQTQTDAIGWRQALSGRGPE